MCLSVSFYSVTNCFAPLRLHANARMQPRVLQVSVSNVVIQRTMGWFQITCISNEPQVFAIDVAGTNTVSMIMQDFFLQFRALDWVWAAEALFENYVAVTAPSGEDECAVVPSVLVPGGTSFDFFLPKNSLSRHCCAQPEKIRAFKKPCKGKIAATAKRDSMSKIVDRQVTH